MFLHVCSENTATINQGIDKSQKFQPIISRIITSSNVLRKTKKNKCEKLIVCA